MTKFVLLAFCLALLAPGFAEGPVPAFEEKALQAGLQFVLNNHPSPDKNLIETMGGGCAFLDYNQDGKLDVYFVNGASIDATAKGEKWFDKSDPRFWNRLYAGLGSGRFRDVTEKAGVRGSGYGMGVAVGDYDNDGYPDLYVTNYGSNELFHNKKDGTFEEISIQAGVKANGWSTSAAFFDYDRDGLLDLYVGRYLDWSPVNNVFCGQMDIGLRSYCHPEHFKGVPDLLYHNEGNGRFKDVSETMGVQLPNGKGLGVAINDYDQDGWPDVYVANDSVPSFLLHNRGGKSFEEVGLTTGTALKDDGLAFAGMGVDFADFDNDGWADLFVTALSLQGYALFRNDGRGTFSDSSAPAGITKSTFALSGWGTRFVDFDNDGWKDILVANGHVMDDIGMKFRTLSYRQPLLLLANGRGRFRVSSNPGKCFDELWPSRGAAFGDFDNDGDIDAVITTLSGKPLLLENRVGSQNHWVGFELVGRRSNHDAIGASIALKATDGSSQTYYVSASGSYLSSSDSRIVIGLGAAEVHSVVISWPSGVRQQLGPVAVRQYHRIVESKP